MKVCVGGSKLPETLLGDGFSTPMPLFCLICTITSNKTCTLDYYQKTNFEFAGVDSSGRVRHPPYSKKFFVRRARRGGRTRARDAATHWNTLQHTASHI